MLFHNNVAGLLTLVIGLLMNGETFSRAYLITQIIHIHITHMQSFIFALKYAQAMFTS